LRFFIDECISPLLSRHLNIGGLHDAIHPRDRGRLRDLVLAHLISTGGDRPQDQLVNAVLTISSTETIRIDPLP
jgi:hypothetical protein